MVWLFAAIGLGILAAVASLLLGQSVVIAAAGWIISGPIAIGLIALFTLRDTSQRARPLYSSPASTPVFYYLAVAAAFAGIIVSALQLASWAGRL